MKITALVSVSLLALAANADDGSITCQTSNGSPQIDQAQRAISDLSGVRSELLCSAETGGFDVMKTQDSARLTISTNIPGGAGLFCLKAVKYLQSVLSECRVSQIVQGYVDVFPADIIYLRNQGSGSNEENTGVSTDGVSPQANTGISTDGVSVQGVSIGAGGLNIDTSRQYLRLAIDRA